MGRLTLNVLLSFAQFEREVTSERIRDKIAASKRKGLWVGGTLPLGYEMKDGKIAIVEEEAELVRSIFRRYLELGSVNELLRDLRERNIRSKTRPLSTGATRGGIPFGRGALYYLLSNHFYIGEVKYKNEILPGEQPPIMDRALFDAVRQKSLAQWSHRTIVRNKSDHLLTGLLFDDAGHRMIPTHATKPHRSPQDQLPKLPYSRLLQCHCAREGAIKCARSWASVYVSGSDHLVRENGSERARIASMRCAHGLDS
jgi:site-specific DNA recombinase